MPTCDCGNGCEDRHNIQFLKNIDANTPHETCMISVGDYESKFPTLHVTKLVGSNKSGI